jgi:uncharacterized membrane protein
MSFILLLIILFILFSHFNLKDRVKVLEDYVARQRLNDNPQKTSTVETISSSPIPTAPQSSVPNPNYDIPKPVAIYPQRWQQPDDEGATGGTVAREDQSSATISSSEFFLYTWFKEQALIKIGSIIFLLGAVWFVSYAIEQNWISPLLRILLGLGTAYAVYVVALLRKDSAVIQYQVLTLLGSGILFGTTIASQFAFTNPVVPAWIAFLLMLTGIIYTLFSAINTKTEWLAITAGVAGFIIPFLINIDTPDSWILLTYLLLLVGGFLFVVFFTNWRAVSLTLIFGTSLHLLSIYDHWYEQEWILWLFVILFSALFFISTTISLVRTNILKLFDVTTLVITSLQLIYYSQQISELPELTMFIVGAICAGVGYTLYGKSANVHIVSLYTALSLIFILVGTAFLFDGFILTIAYAFEVLAVYLLSLKLATIRRTLHVAGGLFLIPVTLGLNDLQHLVWGGGIWHKEALGTICVLGTLGFAIIWTLRNQALRAIDWLRAQAGLLLIVWYLFAIVASDKFAQALSQNIDRYAMFVLLLSIISFLIIYLIVNYIPHKNWRVTSLVTLLIPSISFLSLVSNPNWHNNLLHSTLIVSLLFLCMIISLSAIHWQKVRRDSNDSISFNISYGLLWLFIGLSFLFLHYFWDALLSPEETRIVSAVSYTLLIYTVVNVLLLIRINFNKITPLLFILIIPGLLMIESIKYHGWEEGVLSIDAVGLYAIITILVLLSNTLKQNSLPEPDKESALFSANILYAVSGFLSFVLVWIVSQTVFYSEALAITIALFIYTLAGLVLYSYGRLKQNTNWKQVGVILLAVVILRLALIEVWAMESIWRIVTFIGIGLLFIITALLERPSKNKQIDSSDPINLNNPSR